MYRPRDCEGVISAVYSLAESEAMVHPNPVNHRLPSSMWKVRALAEMAAPQLTSQRMHNPVLGAKMTGRRT
jgi:hypothetical protein